MGDVFTMTIAFQWDSSDTLLNPWGLCICPLKMLSSIQYLDFYSKSNKCKNKIPFYCERSLFNTTNISVLEYISHRLK